MSSKTDLLQIQKGEAAAFRKLQQDARLCIEELREEIAGVADLDVKQRLMSKVANLEDCFDNDDWLTMKDPELALKVAVLGSAHAGQTDLLARFLGGMHRLTGDKTSIGNIGKRMRMMVPWNGKERALLLHTAVGDPGPSVLAWADAILLVFNSAEETSMEAVARVNAKVLRYRKRSDVPYKAVSIQGLPGADATKMPMPLADCKTRLEACSTEMEFIEVNPTTGSGVDKLFDDLIHQIVEVSSPRKEVPKLAHSGSRPSRGGDKVDDRLPAIKQAQFRKHHIHGGSAERWVVLVQDSLIYYHSQADYEAGKPGKSITLLNVSVKTPMAVSSSPTKKKGGEPYFALLTQDFKTGKLMQWKFETQTLAEAKAWQTNIQEEIQAGINRLDSRGIKNTGREVGETKKFSSLTPEQRKQILAVAGNEFCADCRDPKTEWVSLNLTVLVCNECCGIHRNMGVHISRMRSLELDDWKASQLAIAASYGNAAANKVFEANIPEGRQKPGPSTPRADKEKWIRDKYEHMRFISPHVGKPAHQKMYEAITQSGSAEDKMDALVHCATDKGEINRGEKNDVGRTALHAAAAIGDATLVQLLIWAGADANVLDAEQRTPFYLAKQANSEGHVDCAELLGAQESRRSQGFTTPTKASADTMASPSSEEPGDWVDHAQRSRTATLWDPKQKPKATMGAAARPTFTAVVEDGAGGEDPFPAAAVEAAPLNPFDPATAGADASATAEDTKKEMVSAPVPAEQDREADGFVVIDGATAGASTTDEDDQVSTAAAAQDAAAQEDAAIQQVATQQAAAQQAAAQQAAAQQAAAQQATAQQAAAQQAAAHESAAQREQERAKAAQQAQELEAAVAVAAVQEASSAAVTAAPPPRAYALTLEVEVKTALKRLLRTDKVKLWEPPYTGANNEDTITDEVRKTFDERIDAAPALIAGMLSKIRESAVSRKLKKDKAAAAGQ